MGRQLGKVQIHFERGVRRLKKGKRVLTVPARGASFYIERVKEGKNGEE